MTNLEKLRVAELDILDSFADICEKYNLKYYLAYGTLLGAVRHKGFIPWDDDIDVWMFREDYDRFADIAQNELGDKFFYQDYITDPDYPYNFAKIRLNNTNFMQTAISHLDMNHGIYIDIFPLDNARNSKILEKIDWEKDKFLRTVASIRYMDLSRGNVKRTALQRILIKFVRLIISKEKIHKLINDHERKLNGHSSDRIIYRSDENWISFNKYDFAQESIEFEGKYYSAPREYDKILKAKYGDYMKLPPETEQISNHETLVIDFGDYFN